VLGADNQQERLSVALIPSDLGNFLSGFALGEASFMIVCRRRGDYAWGWKLSAAFNVSQVDRAPLDLFCETLCCGSMRKVGNGRLVLGGQSPLGHPGLRRAVLSTLSVGRDEGA
jgi:hypothetical protein